MTSNKKKTGKQPNKPSKGPETEKGREQIEARPNVARIADFKLPTMPVGGETTTQAMETIMTKSKEQFERLSNEAANAGKDHVEALLKSGSIFMKGYEDIMKTYMGLAQKVAEKNGEALKTLLACKTVNEVAEVQNRLAQEGFDELMTGATRLSELSVKLAADGFAPINEQMTRSIKKAGEQMAA